MKKRVQMALAGIFVVLAAVIWAAFLRPVSAVTGTAVITGKVFQPASTYTQSHAGADRGFQSSTSIPVAESYLFFLKIDGVSEGGRVALNTLASRAFEVGQRVRIQYVERGIPFVWRRLVINSMEPL